MTTAVFKDLCVDAADPTVVGTFWGTVLGLDLEVQAGGDAVLRSGGAARIWVNRVPEPKTVKNRVHLDLWVPDDDALGAVLLDDQGEFRVFADPESNEFCAFPGPSAAAPAQLMSLCTDSDRPEEIAAWWAALLGVEPGPGPDGTPRWLPGDADRPQWKFVRVDDERVVKNRWHPDVHAHVEDLLVAGATVASTHPDWTVLRDPDGNEFCAFPPVADPSGAVPSPGWDTDRT